MNNRHDKDRVTSDVRIKTVYILAKFPIIGNYMQNSLHKTRGQVFSNSHCDTQNKELITLITCK